MSHSLGKGLSGKVDGADDLDSLLQSTLQELKLHQVDSADTGKTFGSHPELLNEEVKPLTCEDVGIAIKKLLEKMEANDGREKIEEPELERMVEQVMLELTDENLLVEPFTELAEKYPTWITLHRDGLEKVELERYERQCAIVQKIHQLLLVNTGGNDSMARRKEILRLMEAMQELGNPPEDMLQELGMPPPTDALPECAQM